MKCKVGRDSVEVKVLLFQLGALVNIVVRIEFVTQVCSTIGKILTFRSQVDHHDCKNLKTSRVVKVLLFQLGALVRNFVRMRICYLEV